MRVRSVLAAGAAVLMLASVPAAAAHASTNPNPVTCSGGSSCMIQLESEVHFGGNYSPGTDNAGITVTPPCYWTPLGNARVGSETIVGALADSQEYGGQLTGIYEQIYQQAYKMQSENPIPPGEWYMSLSTAMKYDEQCDQLPFDFVTPEQGGPPPVALTPQDLAELAIAVLKLPTAGAETTSPKGGTTYSNLPTFVAVKLVPPKGGLHYSGAGQPYSEVTARMDDAGATAWAYGSTLKLSATGSGYTVYDNCGYLGSRELRSDPGAVAAVGTGGQPDCGVTFREPQQSQVTAENTWTVCYVLNAENLYEPPAGGCITYPAAMDPTVWTKTFNVEEIQAGNG
jgi:hypothetical protein